MSFEIDRHRYLELFGPTKGDKIRLGDTDLIIEIEKDYTGYGDECKFGGGKVLRDGMGQNAIESRENPMVADLIITGATVVDYTGIKKENMEYIQGFIPQSWCWRSAYRCFPAHIVCRLSMREQRRRGSVISIRIS